MVSLITLVIQILFSCDYRQKNKTDDAGRSIPVKQAFSKPASSYNDTLIISTASAVFYTPDSIQLGKIRSVNTKMIVENMEHDCFYQMRNARMVLKKYWPQILIIEISKTRYLLFEKTDKSKKCIDLNSKNDICGIFLFDPQKDPELIDMMNIDTELGFYFKK